MPGNDSANRRWLEKARARNRAFVDGVNAQTYCAHCGVQPIEWHNPDHVLLKRNKFRIGDMVTRGARVAAIQEEMAACTPLCRRCHMEEDGRMAPIRAHIPPKGPDRTCSECGTLTRIHARGLCRRCYQRQPDQMAVKMRPRPYTGDLAAVHSCGVSEWSVTSHGQRVCRNCQRAASRRSDDRKMARRTAARAHVAATQPRQLALLIGGAA